MTHETWVGNKQNFFPEQIGTRVTQDLVPPTLWETVWNTFSQNQLNIFIKIKLLHNVHGKEICTIPKQLTNLKRFLLDYNEYVIFLFECYSLFNKKNKISAKPLFFFYGSGRQGFFVSYVQRVTKTDVFVA